MPAGVSLHMSCTLCGFSVHATVTALSTSRSRLRWYAGHGERAACSAMQNVYLLGWPWVLASPAPARAPPTCMRRKRTALPTVALARLPGPNAPLLALKPSSSTARPWTMTRGATGWVVACTPCRFSSGWPSARAAVTSTGITSGGQPASTAFTAMARRDATPPRGGSTATGSSGSPAVDASMASMRSAVGATTGNPSPQPRRASSSMSASGASSTSIHSPTLTASPSPSLRHSGRGGGC